MCSMKSALNVSGLVSVGRFSRLAGRSSAMFRKCAIVLCLVFGVGSALFAAELSRYEVGDVVCFDRKWSNPLHQMWSRKNVGFCWYVENSDLYRDAAGASSIFGELPEELLPVLAKYQQKLVVLDEDGLHSDFSIADAEKVSTEAGGGIDGIRSIPGLTPEYKLKLEDAVIKYLRSNVQFRSGFPTLQWLAGKIAVNRGSAVALSEAQYLIGLRKAMWNPKAVPTSSPGLSAVMNNLYGGLISIGSSLIAENLMAKNPYGINPTNGFRPSFRDDCFVERCIEEALGGAGKMGVDLGPVNLVLDFNDPVQWDVLDWRPFTDENEVTGLTEFQGIFLNGGVVPNDHPLSINSELLFGNLSYADRPVGAMPFVVAVCDENGDGSYDYEDYWVVARGVRHWIPSEDVFYSWGFSFANAIRLDCNTLNNFIQGSDVGYYAGTALYFDDSTYQMALSDNQDAGRDNVDVPNETVPYTPSANQSPVPVVAQGSFAWQVAESPAKLRRGGSYQAAVILTNQTGKTLAYPDVLAGAEDKGAVTVEIASVSGVANLTKPELNHVLWNAVLGPNCWLVINLNLLPSAPPLGESTKYSFRVYAQFKNDANEIVATSYSFKIAYDSSEPLAFFTGNLDLDAAHCDVYYHKGDPIGRVHPDVNIRIGAFNNSGMASPACRAVIKAVYQNIIVGIVAETVLPVVPAYGYNEVFVPLGIQPLGPNEFYVQLEIEDEVVKDNAQGIYAIVEPAPELIAEVQTEEIAPAIVSEEVIVGQQAAQALLPIQTPAVNYDTNDDGVYNIEDPLGVNHWYFWNLARPARLDRADFNFDGVIDTQDIIIHFQALFNLGVAQSTSGQSLGRLLQASNLPVFPKAADEVRIVVVIKGECSGATISIGSLHFAPVPSLAEGQEYTYVYNLGRLPAGYVFDDLVRVSGGTADGRKYNNQGVYFKVGS